MQIIKNGPPDAVLISGTSLDMEKIVNSALRANRFIGKAVLVKVRGNMTFA
jgi:hypothetical protein